jgi:hypothetical protein
MVVTSAHYPVAPVIRHWMKASLKTWARTLIYGRSFSIGSGG